MAELDFTQQFKKAKAESVWVTMRLIRLYRQPRNGDIVWTKDRKYFTFTENDTPEDSMRVYTLGGIKNK